MNLVQQMLPVLFHGLTKNKNIFTRVLKGHIAVTNYKLVHNTSGSKLDNLARKYLKEIGLNFPTEPGMESDIF